MLNLYKITGGITSYINGGDPLQGAAQGLVVYFANHLAHGGEESNNNTSINSTTDECDAIKQVVVFSGTNSTGSEKAIGTLTIYNVYSDGSYNGIAQYSAVSGSRTLMPTPNGKWKLSNFRDRTDNRAMFYPGRDVGFSIDITPDPKYGRGALRIHPDGNKPGTQGCIGLNGSYTQQKQFADFAKNYLKINKTMDFYMNGTHWGLDPVTIKP